jgi:hypothetical protein
LKKSVLSAVEFNKFLNNSRISIGKHFLKRKVKAAYEREPLSKSKGFFNLAFIPTPSLFQQPANNIQSSSVLQQNQPPARSTINPQNMPQKLNIQNTQQLPPQNVNKPPQTHPIPNNIVRENININIKTAEENKPEQGKITIQLNNFVNSNMNNVPDKQAKDVHMDDGEKEKESVRSQHTVSSGGNNNNNQKEMMKNPQNLIQDLKKLTPEQQMEIARRQRMIEQQKLNSNLHPNTGANPQQQHLTNEQIRQQQMNKQAMILKQLMEQYQRDPEKLRNELSPGDFQKV